jgi:hypothetical protein
MRPWSILFTMIGWALLGLFVLAALIPVISIIGMALPGGHP